ncbi:MAG: hypothetical protein ABFR89_11925 [Actinomycetota bacterium]
MHWTRIWTLFGVVLGVAALFTKGATSDGEELLPALSQAPDSGFPDGIPTIWGGLATYAQVIVVIAILAVIVFAFMPPLGKPEANTYALATVLIGVALLIYTMIEFMGARDDAQALADGFGQAAAAGAIPAAFTVTVGYGFYLLMAATAFVAIGGLVMIMGVGGEEETAEA